MNFNFVKSRNSILIKDGQRLGFFDPKTFFMLRKAYEREWNSIMENRFEYNLMNGGNGYLKTHNLELSFNPFPVEKKTGKFFARFYKDKDHPCFGKRQYVVYEKISKKKRKEKIISINQAVSINA